MRAPEWMFPLMAMEVVADGLALDIALRAREEGDEGWVPITPEFAEELREEGEVTHVEHEVAVIPQTRRWDANSLCYCVLLADKDRWRPHGLLRIMTYAEFEEWRGSGERGEW